MQLLYFQLQFGVCCKIQSSGEYQKGFEVQNRVFPAPHPAIPTTATASCFAAAIFGKHSFAQDREEN